MSGLTQQQAAGHGALAKGRPAARNIRKCFPSTEIVGKRIKNGSTQFLDNVVPIRTGILCPVAVVLTGALHPCTNYSFFLHAYVFLCTHKCIHKTCLQAAYKQKQQPDLWPHVFTYSFPLPKGLRNSSLVGLPQDLWTDEHTNCKRAELPPHVAPTKVSRSEKPDGRLFMLLFPRSARSCSCWSVPSAVQEDFCAYWKILKYSSFSKGECLSKWPLCSSPLLFIGVSFSKDFEYIL